MVLQAVRCISCFEGHEGMYLDRAIHNLAPFLGASAGLLGGPLHEVEEGVQSRLRGAFEHTPENGLSGLRVRIMFRGESGGREETPAELGQMGIGHRLNKQYQRQPRRGDASAAQGGTGADTCGSGGGYLQSAAHRSHALRQAACIRPCGWCYAT